MALSHRPRVGPHHPRQTELRHLRLPWSGDWPFGRRARYPARFSRRYDGGRRGGGTHCGHGRTLRERRRGDGLLAFQIRQLTVSPRESATFEQASSTTRWLSARSACSSSPKRLVSANSASGSSPRRSMHARRRSRISPRRRALETNAFKSPVQRWPHATTASRALSRSISRREHQMGALKAETSFHCIRVNKFRDDAFGSIQLARAGPRVREQPVLALHGSAARNRIARPSVFATSSEPGPSHLVRYGVGRGANSSDHGANAAESPVLRKNSIRR